MYRLRLKTPPSKLEYEDAEKRLSELPMMVPSRRPSAIPDSPTSATVPPANAAGAPPRQLPQGIPLPELSTPPSAAQKQGQRIRPSWPMPLQPSSSRPRPPPLSIIPSTSQPTRVRHTSQGPFHESPRSITWTRHISQESHYSQASVHDPRRASVRPGPPRPPSQQPSPVTTHSARTSSSRALSAPLPPLREESYDSSAGGSSGRLAKPAPWMY